MQCFPIPFWKMSGAGNDFIVIDHRKPLIAQENIQEIVRKACQRKFGVGADGLVLIETSDKADFSWRFYNSDGSVGEMCGNCARCAARFAYLNGIAEKKLSFETLAGVIAADVDELEVTITMTPAHSLQLSIPLELNGKSIELHSIDTGVPHLVYFVDNIEDVDVDTLGRTLRFHPAFQPAGANVNFVGTSADGIIVRTYERGVEAETQACGTGAVASAVIAALVAKAKAPVKVTTSGGSSLRVEFDPTQENFTEKILLRGAAHVIYKGELSSEVLHSH